MDLRRMTSSIYIWSLKEREIKYRSAIKMLNDKRLIVYKPWGTLEGTVWQEKRMGTDCICYS